MANSSPFHGGDSGIIPQWAYLVQKIYFFFKNVGKHFKKSTNEITSKNKHKKNAIKKEYFLNGQTKAQYDGHFKERRCIWPTKDELFELIKKYPFTTLAKKFGVSDKAITKWCKHYGLPYRKKDIKEIIVKDYSRQIFES